MNPIARDRAVRRGLTGLLVLALVAGVSWWIDDWIIAVALGVLWAGWQILPRCDGIPVLASAFTFQWAQVASGALYSGLTGRVLTDAGLLDHRPMLLIGLGCLVCLMVGLRLGISAGERLGWWPAPGGRLPLSLGHLVALYGVSVALAGLVRQVAWELPGVTQGILALGFGRFVLLVLVIGRLTAPRVQWKWIGLLLLAEVGLGFTGFFADFREPLVLTLVVLLAVFERSRLQHWLVLVAVLAAIVSSGVLWMGIRTTYRQDFANEEFAESRLARAERAASLSSAWFQGTLDDVLRDVDQLVDRVWAIHYPAMAVSRVPEVVPHAGGVILAQALWHVVTPRLLFPDKAVLESDTEMVRRYSGVWFPEWHGSGTSIAFGYAAESYVDFGMPLMFLPVFAYAVIMGLAYQWFRAAIRHRELVTAVIVVMFWLALYLFERSWVKTLGFSLTLMVYLGGGTLLVDRWLLPRTVRGPIRPRRVLTRVRPSLSARLSSRHR